jgi:hypothetical protein
LNPTFKIESPETTGRKTKLAFLLTMDTVSFIVFGENNKCLSLYSYHLPAEASTDAAAAPLKEIILSQNLPAADVDEVVFIYGYPAALIVPNDFAAETPGKEMLELVFGDQSDSLIKTDICPDQNRQTVYAVPQQIKAVTDYIFPSHTARHLYSLLPQVPGIAPSELYCIFYNSSFTAMLLKENKLQAIQTYQYKSPEDVAYYMLQLCESFDAIVNDIHVHLNGMISEESNLYNGISKYFLNLQFDALPAGIDYPETINEYPAHYFSHLFAAAQCV